MPKPETQLLTFDRLN